MAPPAEVRRFLHCNYNGVDLDVLERWYTGLFDLRAIMRSDTTDTDGRPFGLQMPVASDTVFLYDHRGARVATSLEVVRWNAPPTCGAPYADPWCYGLQSFGFRVADLDGVVSLATELGGAVVRRVAGWALLRDPEGLNVEVVEAPGSGAEAHHLRYVCRDLARTREWYEAIGFTAVSEQPVIPAAELYDGGSDHKVSDEVALAASDERSFSLLLTTWDGPSPLGPPNIAPFHQGLYRMAVAVDDVHTAYEALVTSGVARQPPYTFPLPGTPIAEGLTILFLRDPDGVVVELVERSRSIFRA